MKGRRVAILDASIPSTGGPKHGTGIAVGASAAPAPSKATKPGANAKTTTSNAKETTQPTPSVQSSGVLLPIPSFAEIVRTAVKEIVTNGGSLGAAGVSAPLSTPTPPAAAAASGSGSTTGTGGAIGASAHLHDRRQPRRIVQLDNGLICDVDVVDVYIPRIHAGVLRMLSASNVPTG